MEVSEGPEVERPVADVVGPHDAERQLGEVEADRDLGVGLGEGGQALGGEAERGPREDRHPDDRCRCVELTGEEAHLFIGEFQVESQVRHRIGPEDEGRCQVEAWPGIQADL